MHRFAIAAFIALSVMLPLGYLAAEVPIYRCQDRYFLIPRDTWCTLGWLLPSFTFAGLATLAVVNLGVPGLLGWSVARKLKPWRPISSGWAHALGALAVGGAAWCIHIQYFERFPGFLSSMDRLIHFYLIGFPVLICALLSFVLSGGRQAWGALALALFGVGVFDRL